MLYANDTIDECHSGIVPGLTHHGEVYGPMHNTWVCDMGAIYVVFTRVYVVFTRIYVVFTRVYAGCVRFLRVFEMGFSLKLMDFGQGSHRTATRRHIFGTLQLRIGRLRPSQRSDMVTALEKWWFSSDNDGFVVTKWWFSSDIDGFVVMKWWFHNKTGDISPNLSWEHNHPSEFNQQLDLIKDMSSKRGDPIESELDVLQRF